MAERVVDQVVQRLAAKTAPCRTAEVPLVEDGEPIPMGRASLDTSEVRKAIDEECAMTVADVLERRVRANLFASDNGLDHVESVASALAARAGWKNGRRESEVAAYRSRVAEDLAWRAGA